ncbi:MAG: ATPase [Candidatus Hodarchaeales archaeon]
MIFQELDPSGLALVTAMKVLAAAIAIGLGAIGTSLAQGKIGSSAAGMLAERPENVGSAIILVAIPETILVLSFVIAIIILFIGG